MNVRVTAGYSAGEALCGALQAQRHPSGWGLLLLSASLRDGHISIIQCQESWEGVTSVLLKRVKKTKLKNNAGTRKMSQY